MTQDYKAHCNACWHKAGFHAEEVHQVLSSQGLNSISTSCHFMKTEFSHQTGQIIDNSSGLLSKIATLYKSSEFSDVTICVGNKEFHAHKLILSSASDVFKIMLMDQSWADCTKSKILLEEEELCQTLFEPFLQFLYTGRVHLDHKTVLPLLMLADKYIVVDLQNVCIDYMCQHIVTTISNNMAVTWFQYAVLCGHSHLADTCEKFITWNFHKVASGSDFYNTEPAVLLKFLKKDDLVVPDEYILFRMTSKWINFQLYGSSFPEDAIFDMPLVNGEHLHVPTEHLQILSQIRFPMMTLLNLCQLQQDPIANMYSDFFIERIGLAMKFHSSNIEDRRKLKEFQVNPHLYKARNYSNTTWSTDLEIDHFSSLPDYNMQPIVFSSPLSGSEADVNRTYEWFMGLYPKGIHYDKCIMINLWRKLEIEGDSFSLVRILIKSKHWQVCRTEVAVLISGIQDHVEYVKKVVTKRCYFDEKHNAVNIDDILPYGELNTSNSKYLVGEEADTFKLAVVIKPV